MGRVLLLGVSGLTLLVLLLVARDYWRLLLAPRLPHPAGTPPTSAPLVSLLIPARNEAERIARCLDGALAQRYTPYEVIVVDDNSTDATPQILAAYAARDARLRVVQGGALPSGWAGKPNACQQAAMIAQGEWLLFLDADTAPQAGLLPALLGDAERRRLDTLSVFPFMELGTFWERLIMPPFLGIIQAVFPVETLRDPELPPPRALANGQCILVRRAAYDAIGGHEAVRAAVLEDVHLAQALRRAGFRVGIAVGMTQLRVRMYTSLAEVIEGLTKNAVAGARAGGARSIWAGARLNLLAFAPPWVVLLGLALLGGGQGMLGGTVLVQGLLSQLAVGSFWCVLARRVYGLPPLYGLLWPLGLLCYDLIALRAAWFVWSGRGISWKGRAYAG